VYAIYTGEPGREAVLWAAALRAGPGAALSHYTAAELHGLIDQPNTLLHVTIPGHRRVVRIPGVVIHVAARAESATHPAMTPPRTRLEETVLDLAQLATTAEDACGWVTRALGRRLTTAGRL
jgi:predicted transcriptional regulator of viral defense system